MNAWQLNWIDWWSLCSHFIALSLVAIGGAITITPDIHRYLVDEHNWLTDAQFNSAIAIAQAAPGPNVLFIALLGWNVGIASQGWIGAFAAMMGAFLSMIIPSGMLTFFITRWMQGNRERLGVQAFKAGLVPVTLALLVATGWILNSANSSPDDWPFWLLAVLACVLCWRTKIHVLLLLGTGAAVGALLA